MNVIRTSLIALLLDIDGNGAVDGLTDGVLLIRYLLGQRQDALVEGPLGFGASRDAGAIATHLQMLMP